ncbi:efflux RND transporter periplasmic adaptor subunit [Flavobacteriaceae bacterium 14752]|uniref:efflux RND transporter periplasmic adaptor subunit n=1 Tax=Mesohalobacter salilacus TaxID=2491711 RepID=UPI000F638826|nr:efflux RND transporter periplasmic adaptor subunit [Flavobacteriaceae bacterium 14752]
MKTSIYILFLSLFFVFGCSSDKTQTTAAEETPHDDNIELSLAQFKAGNFKIEKADSTEFAERFKATGMIDVPPENRAEVSSFFSGFVSETHLLIGDVVQKGDLLIQLTNPDFIQQQQTFVENYNQLKYLESEYQRKQNLYKDQVVSEKVFQKAKSEFLSLSAKVKGQRRTLELMNVNVNSIINGNFSEKINIYAPISGKISKVNVSKGMHIQPSTMMMEILDTDHIHLELNVFEKDILKVHIGDTLEFKIPEMSTQTFKAFVRLVGAEINTNRSVRVHAHPVSESNNFSVGMFVEAYFKNNPQTQLSLPASAFVEADNTLKVLRLKEETPEAYKFEFIDVENLSEQKNRRALKSEKPIKNTDQFLTQGVFDIVEK